MSDIVHIVTKSKSLLTVPPSRILAPPCAKTGVALCTVMGKRDLWKPNSDEKHLTSTKFLQYLSDILFYGKSPVTHPPPFVPAGPPPAVEGVWRLGRKTYPERLDHATGGRLLGRADLDRKGKITILSNTGKVCTLLSLAIIVAPRSS